MTHNYWGGTAANPADVTVAPLIAYDNPLGSAPVAGIIGVGATSLDASATAGVVITSAANSHNAWCFHIEWKPRQCSFTINRYLCCYSEMLL